MDSQLQALLVPLVALIRQHGPLSRQVKAYVRQHRDVPEFAELAAMLILVATRPVNRQHE